MSGKGGGAGCGGRLFGILEYINFANVSTSKVVF